MTEQKQEAATQKYFEDLLPIKLPSKRGWKIINPHTSMKTLKPLATIMVHNNDGYIVKTLDKMGLSAALESAEEKVKKPDYDLTLAIRRGTNLFAFTKSKEGNKEWYCMYCIPLNDMELMEKIIKDIKKQGSQVLLDLLVSDLKDPKK